MTLVAAIVIGPAGLLIGASVGLIGGYYQIPPSKRNRVAHMAKSSIAEATDKALKTSEKLSYSCVSAFERNGVDIPERCFPQKDQNESDADSRQHSWLTAQCDADYDIDRQKKSIRKRIENRKYAMLV